MHAALADEHGRLRGAHRDVDDIIR